MSNGNWSLGYKDMIRTAGFFQNRIINCEISLAATTVEDATREAMEEWGKVVDKAKTYSESKPHDPHLIHRIPL